MRPARTTDAAWTTGRASTGQSPIPRLPKSNSRRITDECRIEYQAPIPGTLRASGGRGGGRDMATPQHDPRIARTRRMLQTALLDLTREQPLDEITVADIADRAEVNRSSFYQHYSDCLLYTSPSPRDRTR